ncbi:phosphotransferase family protein (plasmid) [Rhodococcus opacus]|uniref:phosphotransferase family protein n=1 Tax=Rhodococcus opacus TaxID=37919 RepID=UPI0034D224EA
MSATIHRDLQIPEPIADADRDDPTPEIIEAIRARFPTEGEYDRMLTRKMERRAGSGYRSFDLGLLTAALENMLRDVLPTAFEVRNARWLTGGASKIQMGFTLRYSDPAGGDVTEDLVLRMEPPESLNATSRMREFEVINALAGTVPVPTVRWVDEDGRWFPEPALVYTWVHGSAKPSRAQSRIAGIGINFGPQLREVLAPQFVDLLARIHTFDVAAAPLDHYERPAVGGTESALWQLNRARRVWEEDRGEDLPLLDVAEGWLEDNLPVVDRVSLVHGDYRGGNFLFDEDSGSVTAILDWERSFLGTAARVSEDAGATGEQQRRATEELSSAISRALRETDELDAATRRRIERAVVAASLHRADVDRAWLLPLGFDPEPSSVRSLQAVFTP